MADEHLIDRDTFRRSTTRTVDILHITGGIRAPSSQPRYWSWYPVLANGTARALAPQPIQEIEHLADALGLTLFGGDEQSGLEGPLISRSWTPLEGPHAGGQPPADTWGLIARNAEKAGDADYALLARHVSYSMRAAGIRLRDASDGYNTQLMAAIESKTRNGSRFANIPMQDLQLAFHSVLSELASTRDYLAACLAQKLGAPAKTDALNRFKEWITAASRRHLATVPVVSAMLAAYDPASSDPWLYHLTEYRNLYLHRQPLGSSSALQFLVYKVVDHAGQDFPQISMPLDASDPFAPGADGLTQFIRIYRAMGRLLQLAADHAPYGTSPPSFVVA